MGKKEEFAKNEDFQLSEQGPNSAPRTRGISAGAESSSCITPAQSSSCISCISCISLPSVGPCRGSATLRHSLLQLQRPPATKGGGGGRHRAQNPPVPPSRDGLCPARARNAPQHFRGGKTRAWLGTRLLHSTAAQWALTPRSCSPLTFPWEEWQALCCQGTGGQGNRALPMGKSQPCSSPGEAAACKG